MSESRKNARKEKTAMNEKNSATNDSSINQINLLRVLSERAKTATDVRQFNINEISQLSKLNDEKEVQRYLFILEGQKLVTPFPAGDFTSKNWRITKDGVRILKTISQATLQ